MEDEIFELRALIGDMAAALKDSGDMLYVLWINERLSQINKTTEQD